jgi:hypothetical protein
MVHERWATAADSSIITVSNIERPVRAEIDVPSRRGCALDGVESPRMPGVICGSGGWDCAGVSDHRGVMRLIHSVRLGFGSSSLRGRARGSLVVGIHRILSVVTLANATRSALAALACFREGVAA